MDNKPRRSRSVDGLRPRSPLAPGMPKHTHPLQFVPKAHPPQPATPKQQRPAQQAASPVASAQVRSLHEPYRLDFTAPEGYEPKRHWWKNLLFPLAILMCLSASFVVQSLPLGVGVIAVYGVVAWIKAIPSRVSFIMAFLALLTVVVLLVVRQNVELAGNFATYTFLLLVTGIVSAMIESRVKPKQRRSKIPHLRA
jgi:hypothetical protein